jgi:hypothetical protein
VTKLENWEKAELKAKLAKIEAAIQQLQEDNDCEINFGCGCCDGGLSIKYNGKMYEAYEIIQWRVK